MTRSSIAMTTVLLNLPHVSSLPTHHHPLCPRLSAPTWLVPMLKPFAVYCYFILWPSPPPTGCPCIAHGLFCPRCTIWPESGVLPCHTPPRSLAIIRPAKIGFIGYWHAQRKPVVTERECSSSTRLNACSSTLLKKKKKLQQQQQKKRPNPKKQK